MIEKGRNAAGSDEYRDAVAQDEGFDPRGATFSDSGNLIGSVEIKSSQDPPRSSLTQRILPLSIDTAKFLPSLA